jgi:hypothetical protein
MVRYTKSITSIHDFPFFLTLTLTCSPKKVKIKRKNSFFFTRTYGSTLVLRFTGLVIIIISLLIGDDSPTSIPITIISYKLKF